MTEENEKHFKEWKIKYFKEPKTEVIYRCKRRNKMYTQNRLLKMFKQAMCIKD